MDDDFPSDLLISILINLPIKSLISSTAVCKKWYSLIRSPSFITFHISNQRNHESPLLVICDNINYHGQYCGLLEVAEDVPTCINSSTVFKLPEYSDYSPFAIAGVCNGVICLLFHCERPIMLWNPSIKTQISLPDGMVQINHNDIIAFGFGVVHDDYKVVRLIYHKINGSFDSTFVEELPLPPVSSDYAISPEVEIFSLKSATWRHFDLIDVKLQTFNYMCRSVLFNGVVHWLACGQLLDSHDSCYSSILAFHVEDEAFYEVALPDELARVPVTALSLPLIVESLVAVKYDPEVGYGELCDVWSMKDYGVKESWTKLYRIQLVDDVISEVLAFCKNGDVLVVSRGFDGMSVLVAYNPKTKGSTDIPTYSMVDSYIYTYVESLALLGAGNGKKHSHT